MRTAARRGTDPRVIAAAVALLAMIAALLWGSDYLARVGAQSLIARAVQHDVGTPNRPSVHVHGAFFLPQVVHGRYDDVEIDVAPVVYGPLRIADLHADLRGVHLPFHDVLVRDVKSLVIDSTAERAQLRYSDLDHYLRAMGNPITVAAAGRPGQVRLTGTVHVLGRSVSASADARIGFDGPVLTIAPSQLDTGTGLDAVSRLLLGQRFTIRIPLSALPFGQTITSARVHPHSVTVFASGRDVLVSNSTAH